MRTLLLCALLGLGSGCVRAQEVFTLKTETHLIDTTISVHDAQGGLVQNLIRNDFKVVEQGVPQEIKFFVHANDLPLSIGLLIDESGSQDKFVKAHEKDIETFVRSILEPKDEAFAVCFGNHLRLVSDVSHDPQAIVRGVHAFDEGSHDFPVIGPDEERALGTALYDAVYFSVKEKLMNRPNRRKVLLILSDGEDNSSEHDLIDTIQAAQNNNVLVFALRYTDMKHNEPNARDRYGMRVLDHLTGETGGRTYDVQHVKVAQAFADLAGELRSLYDLAYQSTNRVRDGRFRRVEVIATDPALVVRSRSGYYAGTGKSEP